MPSTGQSGPAPIPPPHAPVALITGASGGIGLATAEALARKGWRLRIVGRTPKKLEAAQVLLQAISDHEVVALRANFSSLQEVADLAQTFLARGENLDVLINNAGVWHPEFKLSEDGIEDTWAVNHVAPFLLTRLLMPALEASQVGRVVHVASRLHRQAGQTATFLGRIVHMMNVMGIPMPGPEATLRPLATVNDSSDYKGLEAYAQSKLAQVITSAELAVRYPKVMSNAVHPGSVATDVQRDNRLLNSLAPLAKPFLKTPAQGAQTSVYVATSRELKDVSGHYFANSKEATPSALTLDPALRDQLWAWTEQQVQSWLPAGAA